MRLLQIIAGVDPRGGGPSKVIRELCAELATAGHQVELMATDTVAGGERASFPLGRTLLADGYTLCIHRADFAGPPYPSARMAVDLWRRARDFDLAHIHGIFNAPSTSAAAIFRARGLPYVIRTCGMLDPWSLQVRRRAKRLYFSLLERPNLRHAARIQVSTPLEARAVEALSLGRRVALLPQGVGVPAVVSSPPDGALADDRPYVLFLSRVARKKGLVPLVAGFARIAAARPELDLVIAGPDEYGHRAEVAAAVAEHGMTDRVRFVGMVTGPAKWELLSGAATFALPSYDENFGVVVIEAACAGVPVLVSEEVGLADAVRTHGAGVTCRVDADDIARGLERVLSRGKEKWSEGASALADAFTWERRLPPIEAMYEEVLRERGR